MMLILLLEDNAVAAMGLVYSLAAHGHRVQGPVATVSAALDLIAKERPDAAVLDFKLRGGNSIAVAKLLKNERVPFCFVTGYGELSLPESLCGIPQLTKPTPPAEVLTMLEALERAPG